MNKRTRQHGFSLLELLVVISVLGLLATIVVTHVTNETESAKISTCYAYKGDIEIQAEIWMHNRGSWPAGDLSNIGAEIAYFPEGLPTCPVDGTAYTIDPNSGLVIGHNH